MKFRKMIPQTKFNRFNSSRKGFVLIELLLVLALLGIIMGIGTPVYQALQTKNGLDVTANQLAQMLRRARLLANSGLEGSNWGVKVTDEEVILFCGDDYQNRKAELDEIFDMPNFLVNSGLEEVVFEKITAEPSVTGDFVLSLNNDSAVVNLNELGRIDF